MNIKLNTDNMTNTVTVTNTEYNPLVINTSNMSDTITVSTHGTDTITLDGVESIVTSLTTNIDPVQHSKHWYDFDRNK